MSTAMNPFDSWHRVNRSQLIKSNRIRFDLIGELAETSPKTQRRILLASLAANFAVRNPCGLWSSARVEGVLCDLAAKTGHMDHQGAGAGVLHVLSRAYTSGGHARVCERWIAAAPDGERHDVLLISQGATPFSPDLSRLLAERGGRLIRLGEAEPLEKALALRGEALGYRQVVLHVHMQDVIPVLAFGRADFPRPVMLYNHADHLFWLGVSIADLVVNFRQLSVRLSKEARGVEPNAWLPLPVIRPAVGQDDSRERLGIAPDAKIILSVGAPYKFRRLGDMDFLAMARRLLEENPGAYFLCVGPASKGCWEEAKQATGGRLQALGIIASHRLAEYLAVANLFIEPYPMGSFVATLDAAILGVSCLALRNPSNALESYEQAGIYCVSPQELMQRAGRILQGEKDGSLPEVAEAVHSLPAFAKALAALQETAPATHRLHVFAETRNAQAREMEEYLAAVYATGHTPFRQRLGRIFFAGLAWIIYYVGLPRAVYFQLHRRGWI